MGVQPQGEFSQERPQPSEPSSGKSVASGVTASRTFSQRFDATDPPLHLHPSTQTPPADPPQAIPVTGETPNRKRGLVGDKFSTTSPDAFLSTIPLEDGWNAYSPDRPTALDGEADFSDAFENVLREDPFQQFYAYFNGTTSSADFQDAGMELCLNFPWLMDDTSAADPS